MAEIDPLMRPRVPPGRLSAYVADMLSHPPRLSGAQVVQRAKEQLSELSGLKPDTVSAMRMDESGWHVTIEVIELKRVPDSNDVLATYEVLLDDTADLLTYQRIRRYLRGQLESNL